MRFRFVFLLFSFIIGGYSLRACTCAYDITVESGLKKADLVFDGRATGSSVLEIGDTARSYTYSLKEIRFRVNRCFKGNISDTVITIRTGMHSAACGFHFIPGIRYIVFAYWQESSNTYHTSICTPTCNYKDEIAGEIEAAIKKNDAETNLLPDSSKKFVTIHFYYGSKPAKGYKHTESHHFGGIHGGHVFLEIDSTIFSFLPAAYPVHIFAHKRKKQSLYAIEYLPAFLADTAGCKFTSIRFPVNANQYKTILELKTGYYEETPYDYAFFGMRCAAAAYDVLGQAGVVKKRSNFWNVCFNFYPKPMRKRMIRRAKKEGLLIIQHDGRKSRKWEKD